MDVACRQYVGAFWSNTFLVRLGSLWQAAAHSTKSVCRHAVCEAPTHLPNTLSPCRVFCSHGDTSPRVFAKSSFRLAALCAIHRRAECRHLNASPAASHRWAPRSTLRCLSLAFLACADTPHSCDTAVSGGDDRGSLCSRPVIARVI